jgi:Cys-rich repeat protein
LAHQQICPQTPTALRAILEQPRRFFLAGGLAVTISSSPSLTKRWKALFAAALCTAVAGLLAASCGSAGGGACAVNGRPCALGCSAGVGCAECGGDGDCAPGSPFCVLGQCVACRTTADCGAGQACYPRNHNCQPACASNGSCTNGDQPICDPNTGACVGCLGPMDCPATDPICEPTRGQCGQCASNADCGAAAPICDVHDSRCRQCIVDADCGAGFLCNDGECRAGCRSNGDCGGDRPICNLDTGACVGCRGASDCGAAAAICSPGGLCVQCLQPTDCAAAVPFCDDQGRCVQCLDNPQCPAGEKCKDGVCQM